MSGEVLAKAAERYMTAAEDSVWETHHVSSDYIPSRDALRLLLAEYACWPVIVHPVIATITATPQAELDALSDQDEALEKVSCEELLTAAITATEVLYASLGGKNTYEGGTARAALEALRSLKPPYPLPYIR